MLALSCGDCLGNIPHRESIAEFVRFSNNDDVFDLAALITVTSPIYELHLKNLETINATGCSFFLQTYCIKYMKSQCKNSLSFSPHHHISNKVSAK